MVDIGNLLDSTSLPIPRCPNFLSVSSQCDPTGSIYPQKSVESNDLDKEESDWNWDSRLRFPIVPKGGICAGNNGGGGGGGIKVVVGRKSFEKSKKSTACKTLDDNLKDWVEKKVASGVSEKECFLPFLVNAPKMDECRACNNVIYPGDEAVCSVRGCLETYHLICIKEKLGFSNSKHFKCPHHACFVCKQNKIWHCIRCPIASHPKCAPWPEEVLYLTNQPGRAICWRHSTDWRLENKLAVPTNDVEEIFRRLPLPYLDEEFEIDSMWNELTESKAEPPPYVHIRRNVYFVKKKRDDTDADIGCTNCDSDSCAEDCVCRVQSIACSKSCHCSEKCTNRPFRKEKKVKVVKTQFCGWGVEAAEPIRKGDFVIEYTGEVIDDITCERRLWDMRFRGDENFYMCEIRKDFTIDATFKGNTSRFLNHSCDPNCKLEKWQVDGETRLGVFAAQSIKVGEALTYDYRFVHFGSMVKCNCGAENCQGYLGTKRKPEKLDKHYLGVKRKPEKLNIQWTGWGSKRKRTPITCLEVIRD